MGYFMPMRFSISIDEARFHAFDEGVTNNAPIRCDTRHRILDGYGDWENYLVAWDGRADLAAIPREGGAFANRHFCYYTMPGFRLSEAIRPFDWYLDHPELRTLLRYEHSIALPQYMEHEQPIAPQYWRDTPGTLVCRLTICHLDSDSQSGFLRAYSGISFGKHASRTSTGWPKAQIVKHAVDRMMSTPIWQRADARIVDAYPGGESHTDLSIICDREVIKISSRAVPFSEPLETVQNVFGVSIKVPRSEARDLIIETMRQIAGDALLTGITGEISDYGKPQFISGPPLVQLQSFRERVARASPGWCMEGLAKVPSEVFARLIWSDPAPAEPVLLPLFRWTRDRKKKGIPVGRTYHAALSRDGDERRLIICVPGINEAAQLSELEHDTGITGWTRDLPPDGLPVSDLEPIIDMTLD